jgi:YD repeat-containing protein
VVVKTDARGTSSVYYYDALSRLLVKRFTETTPTAYYLFDGTLPTSSATTAGAGSVTITGSEQWFLQDCPNPPCQNTYDYGTVSISVGSCTATVPYGGGSVPITIASALATAFNSDLSSPVNATASNATVTFTARLSGILTKYTLSSSAVTNDPYDFPYGSFGTTQSGGTLTGGSGTCTGTGITLTVTNGIGRRTAMCDAGGAEAWSFDTMGRELSEQRTTSGITKSTSYTYNPDGSMATLTYPTGRTAPTFACSDLSLPILRILFRAPYPASPLLATLTKNPGCGGILPILELSKQGGQRNYQQMRAHTKS